MQLRQASAPAQLEIPGSDCACESLPAGQWSSATKGLALQVSADSRQLQAAREPQVEPQHADADAVSIPACHAAAAAQHIGEARQQGQCQPEAAVSHTDSSRQGQLHQGMQLMPLMLQSSLSVERFRRNKAWLMAFDAAAASGSGSWDAADTNKVTFIAGSALHGAAVLATAGKHRRNNDFCCPVCMQAGNFCFSFGQDTGTQGAIAASRPSTARNFSCPLPSTANAPASCEQQDSYAEGAAPPASSACPAADFPAGAQHPAAVQDSGHPANSGQGLGSQYSMSGELSSDIMGLPEGLMFNPFAEAARMPPPKAHSLPAGTKRSFVPACPGAAARAGTLKVCLPCRLLGVCVWMHVHLICTVSACSCGVLTSS